ncbi:hypothetical protein A3K73_04690 [Candidatus Pacearchaeota archaeon RBG_13_36_9]|nr:MAG: hypothetical protein A3K73_04690 [Candidatus Pacearchaeota archaeon RBG_13_36_9]
MAYKVLINDGMDTEGLEIFGQEGICCLNEHLEGAKLLERIGDFDAFLVRSKTKVTKEVIEAGAGGILRMIGRGGVGTDNIDVDAANECGVVVKYAPNGVTNSTAEQAIALMFSVARKIPQSHAALGEGIWKKRQFEGIELEGKTLGIIGCGRIGQSVAAKARALGMNVMGYDVKLEAVREKFPDSTIWYSSKDKVLGESDVVSLHSGGKDLIIGAEELAVMKPSSILINASRGANIDEAALYEALSGGRLYGAGLDTYEREPKKEGEKTTESMVRLATLENVVLTSHLGASTKEGQRKTSIELARVTIDYLRNGDYVNSCNTVKPSEEEATGYTVCVFHDDVPRMFAQMADVLGQHNINIRAIRSEKVKGPSAPRAITNYIVQQQIRKDALEKLNGIAGVYRVLYTPAGD